ncbi:MAG: DegT/DnrJ/EryC1/StrS family aminotransferase [Thermoguttaceae bacterium]|nr:DegT/DnrJ/EryC1/StrS family aminotransferase [Thermoguttaceae bacterium]
MADRINVTRSYSPPAEEYQQYVSKILETSVFTNNGPYLQKLEKELKDYLNVPYLQFVTNGTVAIQLALRALGITEGEIITTPFSYVATTSAILWERCSPVYVDIEPNSFCINPELIESAITPKTRAILAVHVFGIPCNTEAIADIGNKHGIPVIYDAAHAFGCVYKGKSLLSYGDVSTCSFHATKLFHTIEGGAVICRDEAVHKRADLAKRFGHNGDDHYCLGINAKASELQAAMGLCNLPHVKEIIADRKKSVELYDSLFQGKFQRPILPEGLEYNYSYYPVVFKSEEELLQVKETLESENIFIRRYFYPTLNKLPYLDKYYPCPVSEDVSNRIACLPLYYGLEKDVISKIVSLIIKGYFI